MKIEIRNKLSGSLIFACDAKDMRTAVELALSNHISLSYANLSGVNLRGVNLKGANLKGVDLGDTNLRGANLRDVDLSDTNLKGTNLIDADLRGAKIHNNIIISKAPIQIYGLAWPVIIWDNHMQIGCQFHSHAEWDQFNDREWLGMGDRVSLALKRTQFPALSILCEQHRPKTEIKESRSTY